MRSVRIGLLVGTLTAALSHAAGCIPDDPGSKPYHQALRMMKGEKPTDTSERVGALLDSAVALAPENAAYRRTRSTFAFDEGRYEDAIADSMKAAQLEGPGSAYPLYIAGLAEGALGRYDEALEHFHEAVRRQPKNGQFYAGVALAELSRGHLAEAQQGIETAIQIEPNFQRWRYAQGIILVRAGKDQEAAEVFGRTAVYSEALPGGGIRDIYFDGPTEVARCRRFSAEELKTLWHYGGRWIGDTVLDEYRHRTASTPAKK